MAASVSSVTTMGFSNGTFNGSIALVVTLGYGIGVTYAITRRGSLIGQSAERIILTGQSNQRGILIGQSNERRTLAGYDS